MDTEIAQALAKTLVEIQQECQYGSPSITTPAEPYRRSLGNLHSQLRELYGSGRTAEDLEQVLEIASLEAARATGTDAASMRQYLQKRAPKTVLLLSGNIEQRVALVPAFDQISLELIEYFARDPGALRNLHWRRFEELLDAVFRNQGFETELGSGRGDQGIDLRLIHKDSIGSLATLVQAKQYAPSNPIRLEAVQALYGAVEAENAHRGLFVTTSRYLPGTKEWAETKTRRLELANSDDVARWCRSVAERKPK